MHTYEQRGANVKRALPLLLGILASMLAAGCGEEEVVTTTRNLDRPGPLAMVCATRSADAGTTAGLPLASCTTDAGTGTLYGLVANTSRGEISVFRPAASGEPLVDLDRTSPGFGRLPVGSIPIDLEATDDSCRVVSANRGSCDLSVIDTVAMLDTVSGVAQMPSGGVVSRVIPRTASGRLLHARPQAIALAPSGASGPSSCGRPGAYRAFVTFPACNLVAELDLNTGAILQGLIITGEGFYSTREPNCPVECILRQETGRKDSGPLDLPPSDSPVPRDAGSADRPVSDASPNDAPANDAPASDASASDASASDASASDAPLSDAAAADSGSAGSDAQAPADAGAPADQAGIATKVEPSGVQPYDLALAREDNRLYVSSAGAGFVSVVELAPGTGAFTQMRRIRLAGDVRTTRIRLSPTARKVGRFLYAIASDRSVRVLSTDLEQECESNIDLVRLNDGGPLSADELSKAKVPLDRARCFVVGAQTTPPQHMAAPGNGLRFGARVPQDVIFVRSETPPPDGGAGDAAATATPLRGIFALVALSDGTINVVDVEDWNLVTTETAEMPALHLPHHFRNQYQGTDSGQADAGVSSITEAGDGGVPVVVSSVAPPGAAGTDAGTPVPGNGVLLRAAGESVTSEWPIVYENQLVSRWSGQVLVESNRLALSDPGAAFCGAGVLGRTSEQGRPIEHGDIVVLVGCREDKDCGLEQVCTKPVAQESEYGLCFDKDREDELFEKCTDFLRGQREYVVTRAEQDVLTLDVLPVEPQQVFLQASQPPGGCTSNGDCNPAYLCALADWTAPGQRSLTLRRGQCFRSGCVQDKDCGTGRCVQPLDGSAKVCSSTGLPVETGPACTSDAECRAGSGLPTSCTSDKDCNSSLAECRGVSSESSSKTCVDKGMTCAAFPGLRNVCMRKSPCFQDLLRYDVRAGRAFVVSGAGHRVIADPTTGQCTRLATESPLLENRIPVGLPVYPVLLGPQCVSPGLPLDVPQPNACFERMTDGYVGAFQAGDTGEALVNEPGPSTVVRYANAEFALRLGVSHLAHPSAASGSAGAALDGGVAAATNPMPARGLTITVQTSSGFARLSPATASTVALPTWLVEAPDGFVYIVDTGDRSGSTGTSGQVLRFDRETLELDDFLVH